MLATILAMLEEAPDAVKLATEGIDDVKTLLSTPEGQAIEAAFAKLFTVTTTPGSAAVVEPIVKDLGMTK